MREGLSGTGTSGKRGTEEWNLETSANAKDQGCRGLPPEQQCPSGVAQRPQHHAIAVRTAMQNSHKHNVRSSAVGKELKQKKSNSLCIAQYHLPALDLFWASFFVGVQLTSLLLISPVLWSRQTRQHVWNKLQRSTPALVISWCNSLSVVPLGCVQQKVHGTRLGLFRGRPRARNKKNRGT